MSFITTKDHDSHKEINDMQVNRIQDKYSYLNQSKNYSKYQITTIKQTINPLYNYSEHLNFGAVSPEFLDAQATIRKTLHYEELLRQNVDLDNFQNVIKTIERLKVESERIKEAVVHRCMNTDIFGLLVRNGEETTARELLTWNKNLDSESDTYQWIAGWLNFGKSTNT